MKGTSHLIKEGLFCRKGLAAPVLFASRILGFLKEYIVRKLLSSFPLFACISSRIHASALAPFLLTYLHGHISCNIIHALPLSIHTLSSNPTLCAQHSSSSYAQHHAHPAHIASMQYSLSTSDPSCTPSLHA